MCHCFTRDIEGPYTAIHMPSTINFRISEMAIVGQTHPLICCINFSGHLSILQDIWEFCCLSAHKVSSCGMRFAAVRLGRADKHLPDSVTEPKETFRLVFVFQIWKMTLDHIESHSKFAKRLHIYQSRIAPNIM